MLKKHIALLNYIIGSITTAILVIVFLTLANTNSVAWLDKTSGTSSVALSGITFAFSFLTLGIVYSITTLSFSDVEGMKRSWLPIILSALFMSAIASFIVLILDYEINHMWESIILFVMLMIIFCVMFIVLITFVQELNTKFLLSAISATRSDEWEYSNFMKLSIYNISVKHENGYTELGYKDKLFITKFIPEEIVERKIFLSGDTKSKDVAELENVLLAKGDKGAIVYLSNRLPIIEGSNDKIEVTTNINLLKLIKGDKHEK